MHRRLPIAVFAAFLFAAPAWACETLVAMDRAAAYQRPPTLQGALGICYAHAVADLLSEATGKDVSPVHAMLVYSDRERQTAGSPDSPVPQSGYGNLTLFSLIHEQRWVATNACVDGRSPDYDQALTAYYRNALAGRPTRYRDIPETVCPAPRASDVAGIMSRGFSTADRVDDVTRSLNLAVRRHCREGGAPDTAWASLEGLTLCGITRRTVRGGADGGDGALVESIRYALRGGSPVMYGFEAVTFDHANVGDRHQVVITGQREIGGVCHFIARNFWDTPCLDEWPARGIHCSGHGLGSRSFAIPVALAGHAAVETSAVFRGAPPTVPAGARAPMACR